MLAGTGVPSRMRGVGVASATETAIAPGSVLIAGGGLWADALSRVVTRGGGTLLIGASRDHALSSIATHRPNAIVVGPPLTDGELIELCRSAVQSSSASTVLAAVNRADSNLRKALAEVGVARVCIVPSAASDLAVAMINAAHLTTRAHARVPLEVAIHLQTREGKISGTTRDLSEGGVCVGQLPERPSRGQAKVEFQLPGERTPIAVVAQIVWGGGANGDFRAGLAFEKLEGGNLARIRLVVSQSPVATFTF